MSGAIKMHSGKSCDLGWRIVLGQHRPDKHILMIKNHMLLTAQVNNYIVWKADVNGSLPHRLGTEVNSLWKRGRVG